MPPDTPTMARTYKSYKAPGTRPPQYFMKCPPLGGEGQGLASGQTSDYTLRGLNPLNSRTHDQTFYQDFRP